VRAAQAVLSRCVQHSRLLVQYLSLECLQLMLANLEPLFTLIRAIAVAASQGEAAGSGTSGEGGASVHATAAAAQQLHRRLRAAVRARLPDLQTLLKLHSTLELACSAATSAGSGGAAAGSAPPPATGSASATVTRTPGAAMGVSKGQAANGLVPGAPAADVDMSDPADSDDGDEEEDAESSDGGAEELEAAVFGGADPRARPHLALVRLLSVIAAYCRLLPESAADAHLDPVKLLPEVQRGAVRGGLERGLRVLRRMHGRTAACRARLRSRLHAAGSPRLDMLMRSNH
jgi:hypothetical protein